ncbi:MAG: diaminopimelate epimerase [Acidobacteria bacterium]|nr:diaminopimelate epimerase [Acidobacteriota bacterium]
MQRIHFYKMTGTGNDFIVIDNRKRIIDADHCHDFVRGICRHRVSVGADGVILIENDTEVDFRWRFFNADGSEPKICGNGARCAARFAYLTGIVDRPRMSFRTGAGIIAAELLDTKVKVQMPAPTDMRRNLDVEIKGRSFALDFINTGVPHAVCFLKNEKELETVNVARLGRALRAHDTFRPEGTNVDFVFVENPQRLNARTYERGVEGETLACGTGAIASVLLAAVRGEAESPAEVRVRSGETLTVYFKTAKGSVPFEDVCLEGNTLVVYEADLWSETMSSVQP